MKEKTTKFKRSSFRCPSCGEFLACEKLPKKRVVVWCAVGRCASEAAAVGQFGTSQKEAFHLIEQAVDMEGDVIS